MVAQVDEDNYLKFLAPNLEGNNNYAINCWPSIFKLMFLNWEVIWKEYRYVSNPFRYFLSIQVLSEYFLISTRIIFSICVIKKMDISLPIPRKIEKWIWDYITTYKYYWEFQLQGCNYDYFRENNFPILLNIYRRTKFPIEILWTLTLPSTDDTGNYPMDVLTSICLIP